jgi:hypothetical protein
MHVVLLQLVDGSKAPQHMEGHKEWLKQAFADEVVSYVGGRSVGGAVVLAYGLTTEALRTRLAEDPLVSEGIVDPEIIELDTTMSDPRLSFMVEFQGERLGYQRDGAAGADSRQESGAH